MAVNVEPEPEPEPIRPEQFRRSYASVAELPQLPTQVIGFEPAGDVGRSSVRLLDSSFEFTIDSDFPSPGNQCESVFWVARWVLASPEFNAQATEEINWMSGPESYDIEEWLLPPAGPGGLLGNMGCLVPGFRLVDDPGNSFVDVIVEYQYFSRDDFAADDAPTDDASAASTTSCDSYVYDDELPISVCSQGFSVELFQQAIGLNADGYFGPGTETAVRSAQGDLGLPVTGVIDAALWGALGVTANAPFPDLNGDGVIDGSEFPGT